jgi:AraC family transcriptional regulator of adaptative response/methylated-DNA-[protein]-cysteine methyltransferase
VLDTTYELGLSGPARLHDHFVSLEVVTPGEYKKRGAGLQIRYGIHPSPFGPMFLAVTERGVCWLFFPGDKRVSVELGTLRRFWQGAEFVADEKTTGTVSKRIFDRKDRDIALTVLVKGTNFQTNVWKALLRIPPGLLCSYDQIARAIGVPAASRAVGNAVAANPVGYLIPCHRVVRKAGRVGHYRWGDLRKRALIAWEALEARDQTKEVHDPVLRPESIGICLPVSFDETHVSPSLSQDHPECGIRANLGSQERLVGK